ncbi:hypothetical protein HK097_007684 [Rhizophlyctis rosea]|uniref:Uncharacterized protein n=1 Tax=Rhizophlyctis rosea TaxID=64517 RepID=A0AAD5X521_9FUNG|nr:hypothetical protein HK097_007684 [Rhizophlyctis rosea]
MQLSNFIPNNVVEAQNRIQIYNLMNFDPDRLETILRTATKMATTSLLSSTPLAKMILAYKNINYTDLEDPILLGKLVDYLVELDNWKDTWYATPTRFAAEIRKMLEISGREGGTTTPNNTKTRIMTRTYRTITPDQISHFLSHGWVRIPSAFTPSNAQKWTKDLWTRLGYDPLDKSTWTQNRINMPHHSEEDIRTFAPKAWDAICDLVGGEQRIETPCMWSDGFIVNLGTDEWERDYKEGKPLDPKELDNWHVDGDFFVHFLDSREQGLLVIPLFTDILPNGGGTMISPDGIGIIARHLRDNPQGVTPRMAPLGKEDQWQYGKELGWYIHNVKNNCQNFAEMTGNLGDVILLHPFMFHSASRNRLRRPRVITNPPVSLKEPFNYDRPNREEYSLVEEKTLRELGAWEEGGLKGWKIVGERKRIVPDRLKVQNKMKELEEKRLRGEEVGGTDVTGTTDQDGEIIEQVALMV